MQKVRLHFSKTFSARFISHLDLMRCFTRAIKKSRLDVWYTEGFNPHLYLTFALALPLGFESICETVDIRLTSVNDFGSLGYSINAGLPFGLEVFNASLPVYKPADIAKSRYLLEFSDSSVGCCEINSALNRLLIQPELIYHRTNKKGVLVSENMRPYFEEIRICNRGNAVYLSVLLPTGSEKSVNPAVISDTLQKNLGHELDHVLIKRVQTLVKNGQSFE